MKKQKSKCFDGLVRYPVPIGDRTAYMELPRNLTARDIERLRSVMISLVPAKGHDDYQPSH